MTYIFIVLILALVLFVLYILSTRCNRPRPHLRQFRNGTYAHRGLHTLTRPENSLSAFRAAAVKGYGIELDVHLLKDGQLAVIHDSALSRTTGAQGRIEDLESHDLWHYRLEGSYEHIPTLQEVLSLVDSRVPLIIELKAEGNNHAALTEAACKAMEGYEGPWCMESFDPRCVLWLKKNRPDVIRGQLTENFLGNPKSKLPWILKFLLTWQLENFLIRPDFVAYKFADRKNLSVWICKHIWKLQCVGWTIKTPEEYAAALKEGWLPIFENFTP